MIDDVFGEVGVPVDIIDEENFLKIKETLTRIGIASKANNRLYQSCHILHKRNSEGKSHYAIVHFKEMFWLDGKSSTLSEQDIFRRNAIANLLSQWNLVKLNKDIPTFEMSLAGIKVIPFKDKSSWDLIPKYKVGKKN